MSAAGLLPLCSAFAAAVEFSQLWFPKRTCAGSDVIAQTLGSATGMLGDPLVVAPQRLEAMRGLGAERDHLGEVGPVLAAEVAEQLEGLVVADGSSQVIAG